MRTCQACGAQSTHRSLPDTLQPQPSTQQALQEAFANHSGSPALQQMSHLAVYLQDCDDDARKAEMIQAKNIRRGFSCRSQTRLSLSALFPNGDLAENRCFAGAVLAGSAAADAHARSTEFEEASLLAQCRGDSRTGGRQIDLLNSLVHPQCCTAPQDLCHGCAPPLCGAETAGIRKVHRHACRGRPI
jgi:hypothetical protein